MVDKLGQQSIDRIRAAYVKRDANLQAQIDRCLDEIDRCRERLRKIEVNYW